MSPICVLTVLYTHASLIILNIVCRSIEVILADLLKKLQKDEEKAKLERRKLDETTVYRPIYLYMI
jgi:hypothetical protein